MRNWITLCLLIPIRSIHSTCCTVSENIPFYRLLKFEFNNNIRLTILKNILNFIQKPSLSRWEQMQWSMSDFFGSDTVYAKESRTYTVASAPAVTGSILIRIFRLLFGTVQILLSTLWWTIYCLHIDPYLSVCWFVFNAFSLSVLWYWLISIVTVPLLLSNGPMGELGGGV